MPAVAVIRRGQALFALTGRKGYVGCVFYLCKLNPGITLENYISIKHSLSICEVCLIYGVKVKFDNIVGQSKR